MAESSRSGRPAPRMDHVGLAVADLDAAMNWYTTAFGYQAEFVNRIEAIDLDLVMLVHREHGDRLELLHRGGAAPARLDPKPTDPATAARIEGFGHVAFDVQDLDGSFERLVGLGARPVMSPGPSPVPGIRMAFVADPEGNLLELLERGAAA